MATTSRHAVGRIWSNSPATAIPAATRPEHVNLIRDSHARCTALGLTRIDTPDHARLIRSDLNVARERNRRLHGHAAPVMELLYDQIAGTESMIVLTDAQGTILHAVGDDDFLERASKVALAAGANWAEQSKGTNAVGTALFAERPTLVHADEHFMHANSFLTCSAAPIFDPRGNVLGVLDVSGDQRSYHQHTMGLVRMSARMIENHWLCDDGGERLRIHFHTRLEYLGTLAEGILVVGGDGRIVGANRSALDQIGVTAAGMRLNTLESLTGLDASSLVDAFRRTLPLPRVFVLGDGRRFHFMARPGSDYAPSISPLAPAEPALAAAVADIEPAPLPDVEPSLLARPRLADYAGADARVAAAVAKLERVIDRGIAWVVVGDTGTGKQWLARAAHHTSARADAPFIVLRPGPGGSGEAIERAFAIERATLYLDALGEWTAPEQARLLHRLEERRADIAAAHVGIVASSRRVPLELVAAGTLREDLYYRLAGFVINLPRLADRSDLHRLAARLLPTDDAGRMPTLDAEAAERLARHPWPGNLRELANVLHTAAVLADGSPLIRAEHLPDGFGDPADGSGALRGTLEEAEVEMIRRAVEAAQGNISVASRKLGISRNTIYRKLRWNR